MKGKNVLLVALISGLLLALTPVAATAAPPNEDDGPDCNPRAVVLAGWMGLDDCSVLMDLQDEGVGFGVIMKAYFLSPMVSLNWEDLARRHTTDEGLGWGQIMKAHLLAERLPVDADTLLEMRADGMGWGEILKELSVGPGNPPWAGKGKPHRTDKGKPPWAGPHLLGE